MANLVDAGALIGDLEQLSQFGRTPEGGVHREAATQDDGRARDWLVGRLRDEGFSIAIDPVGNMFAILEIAGPDAPLVMVGSHLDSQPHGGRFDGPAGVLAALHAALAARAESRRGRITPQQNVCVVNWTNEEGSRFAPSIMGSAVYAGLLPLETALAATDRDGTTLEEALRSIGYLGRDIAPRQVSAYIELHIEQGTALEQARCPVAVVGGNWGTVKYIIDIQGRASHTGPTPMADRIDALLPAATLILRIRELSDRTGGALLSSVGRLDVVPNSTNIVAQTVRLFAELRDRDPARLRAACAELEAFVPTLAVGGVAISVRKPTDRPAGHFDEHLKATIVGEANRLGIDPLHLDTVAGHDAVNLARIVPTAMIFVPSRDGISHNPREYTSDADLHAGSEVLAAVVRTLVAERPA